MTTTLLVGDVRERIKELADESVHCVVTSPPYFGLRDYGMAAQIGLEPTPDAYVAEMVSLFREVRRVLRSDGTFWLNLGDSYASKQRLMIPARVALALQDDDWWLRDEIIWHKPNPMPAPLRDRTVCAHEMLHMFTKTARYHYDFEAIAEAAEERAYATWNERKESGEPPRRGLKADFRPGNVAGLAPRNGKRNKRSVWTITPKPFKGAHFATFPPDLIRPCILAGCPIGGTVLDPFFGAGTTGLVAAELSRSCIGFELNPEYAQIARERLGLDCPTSPVLSNLVDLAAVRAEIDAGRAIAALQARLAANWR